VSATNELLVNSVMCCMSSRHGLNVDALHCSKRGGRVTISQAGRCH